MKLNEPVLARFCCGVNIHYDNWNFSLMNFATQQINSHYDYVVNGRVQIFQEIKHALIGMSDAVIAHSALISFECRGIVRFVKHART